MYQEHWGLAHTPFRAGLDPKDYYPSPTHEEALARLRYLVEAHRRLGVLFGPAGSGKSLLLAYVADQLSWQGRAVALVSLLGLEPTELLWRIGLCWGLNPAWPQSPPAIWQMLTDRLVEYRYQQIEAVVLLDDAGQARPDVLCQVERLLRLADILDTWLTVVLTARNDELGALGSSLLELVDLRMELEAWQFDDTRAYLTTQLKRAGCREPVFTASAIERLQLLSGGSPRRIVQLADLALLAGAGEGSPQIDAPLLDAVWSQLTAGTTL